MISKPDIKSFATLVELLNHFNENGYNHSFNFEMDPPPDPVEWCIVSFYRFEGQSNPSDNSIVYLLTKKDDSEKGMLVNSYGIYASEKASRFIQQVSDCKEN